eukprot:TRINITY_DN8814_c0_g1_i1.p1 TRINITY_DN8814_c0_g1~~TRINITY_DN8814_c0_g1_i1.p1  ORF type:complete len:189 (+),score=29.35 TRINITY_DN8814_c0_g1_i1:46-612(+)
MRNILSVLLLLGILALQVHGATFTFRFVGLLPMGTTTIGEGDEICWRNDDILHHTSTSSSGSALSWDSDIMAPGDVFCFTFPQQGSFPYVCAIHADIMTGTVVVQEAGSVVPPPVNGGPAPGQQPISSGSEDSPLSSTFTPVTSKLLTAAMSTRSSFPLTYSDVFAFSSAPSLVGSAVLLAAAVVACF